MFVRSIHRSGEVILSSSLGVSLWTGGSRLSSMPTTVLAAPSSRRSVAEAVRCLQQDRTVAIARLPLPTVHRRSYRRRRKWRSDVDGIEER